MKKLLKGLLMTKTFLRLQHTDQLFTHLKLDLQLYAYQNRPTRSHT